ncbi:MAG: hypothetical protein PHE49_03980 [bacterium]|nr:hypothetical protein [bacterium]
MKIVYSLVSCIVFAFLIFCLPSCRKIPPERLLYRQVDSTWIIPENDSVMWKRAKAMPSNSVAYAKEDTLHINITHEDGPSAGRVVLSAHETEGYEDIKKDTTYAVDWYWKIDNCDTLLFKIVNTSSSDTLKVKTKIEIIDWTVEGDANP